MNSDDDTVAEPSDTTVAALIDTVAEGLFIGKKRSKVHEFCTSIDRQLINIDRRSITSIDRLLTVLIDTHQRQVYSRNLVKFSTYDLFSHQS